MHPEAFEHHAAIHEYAERHGLTYLWEGAPSARLATHCDPIS
jgi:hypothetical protein